MNTKTRILTTAALCVAINIIGSKLALLLSLPIFLDSIGTILGGMAMGPGMGALIALVSGVVNATLGDSYALYFSVSGMIMGALAGFVLHHKKILGVDIIWKTGLISIPASFVSSIIATYLFSGITSSVFTTVIIQTMSKTASDLFTSTFVTQLVTDYFDKFIAIVVSMTVVKKVPHNMLYFADEVKKNEESHN